MAGRGRPSKKAPGPVPPLPLAEWGADGAPTDYDPEATTGKVHPVPGAEPPLAPPGPEVEYPQEAVPGAELVEVSPGDGNELPHWADPPTGEVPRALAGHQSSEDEMQAWRMLGSRGLHWRDDVNSWSDSPGMEDLVDAGGPSGVDEMPTGDPFSFDDDFARLERERGVVPDETGYDAFDDDGFDEDPSQFGEEATAAIGAPRSAHQGVMSAGSGTGSSGAGPGEDALPADADATRALTISNAPAQPHQREPRAMGRIGARVRQAPPRGTPTNSSLPTPGPAARHNRRPYDIGAEPSAAVGRDVGAAVLTGIGLLALFVICYAIGPGALLVLAALVLVGCAFEAFSMLQRAGFRPATLVGALGSGAAVLAAYWRGPGALSVVFVLVLGATLVWYLARVVEARPVVNIAVTIMAFAWVGVLGSFAGVLLQAPYGERLFVGAVVPTAVADVVAWFAGSRFGSRPLAPSISPGKTWEGVFAGAVAAVVVAAVIGSQLRPWGGVRHGIELGLVIAVAAPVGDLVQSMVKRDLRLKDSGSLLPGHGGLLDRFDSLLFVLPATYYLATVLHLV